MWRNKYKNFDKIFVENKKLLSAIALDVIDDAAMVDDILQEVYISVSRNWKKLSFPDSMAAASYLAIATKNTAISYYRQRKKIEENESTDSMESLAEEISLESVVISREKVAEVIGYIEELDDELRQILVSSVFYQLSDREIGEQLRISENSVRVKKHRAREKLKRMLEVRNDDE
ncbi:MAG: sigma-70 family RNA polymerase sigma factor [Bacillota bacterium]|nr:sigma-70 family RNA polymerase sigma factor [Bacillota bacterium]